MKSIRFLSTAILAGALLTGGLATPAQGRAYGPDQINQMVAPIALYPDALMSQVLMAATFPDQVTDADQWVRSNPGLSGRDLDDALATATWDPSIIALCKFPSVLDRMAQNITWTDDLGRAFLYQRADVMDAVQTLRSEAYRNGSLRTTTRQRVVVQGPDIVIQPYSPEVVYVPVYQPAVVYGPLWSYPTYYYPAAVWAPWPGYSFVNGFAWGVGFAVGNILFGGCDWHHHDVYVNNTVIVNNTIYHNTPYYRGGHWRGGHDHQPWQHHGDGVGYARGGGTGAPYGGRDHGGIRGVRPEPAVLARGESGRGFGRPTTHGPAGFDSNRRDGRPDATGPSSRLERGASRTAAHGPTGFEARRTGRSAQIDSSSREGRRAGGPAVHGPTGYPSQRYDRPIRQGSASRQERSSDRPAFTGRTGYGGRAYDRPAPGGSMTRPDRGAGSPSLRPRTGGARPAQNRSEARATARARSGSPSGARASGTGRAPQASRGGKAARAHR